MRRCNVHRLRFGNQPPHQFRPYILSPPKMPPPPKNHLLQPPLPSLPILPPSHLNLMPFRLAYTGPAEVSTYFMPREVVNPAFVSKEETPTVEEKITVAAFRGRRVQAREINIPEGYTGVVLSAPPSSSSSSLRQLKAEISKETNIIKTRVEEVSLESGPRRSPRKRKAEMIELEVPEIRQRPKKREMKKFSMDSDSEEGGEEREAEIEGEGEGEETLVADDNGAQPEHQAIEEASSLAAGSTRILTAASSTISLELFTSSLNTLDPLSPFFDSPQQQKETRTLTPTGRFDRFTLWNPDGPVDTGRDEYCRALGEWMRLGAILHAD